MLSFDPPPPVKSQSKQEDAEEMEGVSRQICFIFMHSLIKMGFLLVADANCERLRVGIKWIFIEFAKEKDLNHLFVFKFPFSVKLISIFWLICRLRKSFRGLILLSGQQFQCHLLLWH